MTTVEIQGVILNVAGLTDTGLKRTANEDSFLATGPAFVVADGMGGYESGDRASHAVVSAFAERFTGPGFGDFAAVNEALIDADDRVELVAQETTRGAGSTATGLVLVDYEGHPHWLVFNVGDSRVYRHVGSTLEQVTKDHSLGMEMVDRGEMTLADLATFKDRNVITRAIGAADSLADSWLVPAINGERFLVCSDGLHGEVDDEGIRAILTMNGKPEDAAQALVDRAKAHGGRDNITVVVLDVVAGANDEHNEYTTAASGAMLMDLDDTLTS